MSQPVSNIKPPALPPVEPFRPDPDAVYNAVLDGNLENVQVLIEEGGSLDFQDANGRTPLHLAAMNDHPAIVQALIDGGANLNTQDTLGNTPLHLAAHFNKPATALVLINNDADLDIQNYQNHYSPLHMEASRLRPRPNPAVIKAMVEGGADTTLLDAFGRTPAQAAIHRGYRTAADQINAIVQGINDEINNAFGNDSGSIVLGYLFG